MRRLFLTFFASFFAILVMLFLYVFLPQYLQQKYGAKLEKLSGTIANNIPFIPHPTPFPTPVPTPSPDLSPATLIIPKLKIQAAVEPVGQTETGNMNVPKDTANVAWYQFGARPSEQGNAVIAGHLDTPTGRPAVFWSLKTLQKGDEVETISANAVRSTFVVTGVSSIPLDKFPNEEVFKTKPGKNLNLITCGGVWNSAKKIYSNRIVVYTTLKE